MYGYGYGPDFGIMHAFSWIFWIILIVFLVKMFRHSHGGKGCRGMWCNHDDSAVEILKERYAKGEINREEFEAKKKDLSH